MLDKDGNLTKEEVSKGRKTAQDINGSLRQSDRGWHLFNFAFWTVLCSVLFGWSIVMVLNGGYVQAVLAVCFDLYCVFIFIIPIARDLIVKDHNQPHHEWGPSAKVMALAGTVLLIGCVLGAILLFSQHQYVQSVALFAIGFWGVYSTVRKSA
jgi:hypothetical protein